MNEPNHSCDGFADTAYGMLEPVDQAPAHLDDCQRCGNRECVRLAHLYAYVNRERKTEPCRTAEV